MTPIEIIEGRYGAKILTGATETDISTLNVVAIVIRSAGATIAQLEIDDIDVVTARGLGSEALDSSDVPLLAGYNKGLRTTKTFNLIKMTNATDSVWLIFGE